MCGIFGIISKNALHINKNILPHRGPDDWGLVHHKCGNDWLSLFQSRLSIIGLGPQGHQPYQKYDNYTLAYNGEIYNYDYLKKLLVQKYKINFITKTDTEVLYESLINLGINTTLEVIDGIFAFVFYDQQNERLLLVRDHLGVKPLYYHVSETQILFGSEPKVFFELGLMKPVLNKNLLGEYFANGWIYEPDTLFEEIYKVEAGHYLCFDLKNKTNENKQYWDVSNINRQIGYDIPSSIISQTVSDVPVGIYFSGGIDSSIIAYTLKDRGHLFLNLDLNDTESIRARQFEKLYNLRVNKIQYEQNKLSIYDDMIYHLDEPVADPAIIPTYLLAKTANELGCTVMLSGMGGDEIDAGYTRHRILLNIDKYSKYKLLPLLPFLSGKRYRDLKRLKNFLKNPVPSNYFSLTAYFSVQEINQLLQDEWYSAYSRKIDGITSGIDGLKKYFYLDLKGFLASHNLIYMDKASMAASIEVRVPLLQKDNVAALFMNLDTDNKKEQKSRLTALLQSQQGSDYLKVKKQGFRYPINDWILNQIDWKYVIEQLGDNNIINPQPIKEWVNISKNNVDQVSMKLWYVYTLHKWFEIFGVSI